MPKNGYTVTYRANAEHRRVRYEPRADGDGYWREEAYHNGCRWLTCGREPVADVCVDGAGDIVLRDSSGTEYARFEGRDAVFSRADPYPSAGENTVKRPVIPTTDADHVSIVVVPDGADSLDHLRFGSRPPVPEKCQPLWALLTEEVGHDDEVSKLQASDLAEAHGLGISQATVYRHMGALEDAGCLVETGEGENGATLFALV